MQRSSRPFGIDTPPTIGCSCKDGTDRTRATRSATTLIDCWTNGVNLRPSMRIVADENAGSAGAGLFPLRRTPGDRSHPQATRKQNCGRGEKYRSERQVVPDTRTVRRNPLADSAGLPRRNSAGKVRPYRGALPVAASRRRNRARRAALPRAR